MPSDEPAAEPAHPQPAAAARTAAAGAFLAFLAAASAAVGISVIPAARLFASGDDRLVLAGASAPVLGVAYGLATAAALILLTRRWAPPRVVTVLLTAGLSIAWPLSTFPLPAALVTLAAITVAVVRDRRVPGGRRVDGAVVPSLLILASVLFGVAGAALADTRSAVRVGPAEPSWATVIERATPSQETTPAPRPEATAKAKPRGKRVAATPSRPARPAADAFVRNYYAALNERRFAHAWARLSPAVRARFGGFAHWKDGYGRTLSSLPSAIQVSPGAVNGLTVTHLLVARDRGCNGPSRFRVTWRLRANGSTWSVDGLSAVAEGAAAC